MLRPAPRLRAQRGITLLESLVALLITAVALLGMVGVQLRTLADTQTAVRRAQAVRLIEDLSERLQANPHALLVLDQYVKGWAADTGDGPACTTGCNAQQLAQHDIDQWRQSVQATLPLGDAATFLVTGENVDGARRQLGVMLSWRENEAADADTSYRAPLALQTQDAAGQPVDCPSGRICHLQYLQPSARCAVSLNSGPTEAQLYCPAKP